VSAQPPLAVPLASEQKEVRVQRLVDGAIAASTEPLTLVICRCCAFFAEAPLARALPDAAVREGAKTVVAYKDVGALRQQMGAAGGVLAFTLDRVAVELKHGEHFFLGAAEAAKAGIL